MNIWEIAKKKKWDCYDFVGEGVYLVLRKTGEHPNYLEYRTDLYNVATNRYSQSRFIQCIQRTEALAHYFSRLADEKTIVNLLEATA